MKREYYFRPPELTGEKILETFLHFQDDRDIPIFQNNVNNFFIDNLSYSTSSECENGFDFMYSEIVAYLLSDIEFNGVLKDILVICESGESILVDDTLIVFPRIYLRITE